MFRFLCDTARRLRRDERGNVFVLFGASAIPLLLLMGGAVDIARYERYKTELVTAVDAAALALARQHDDYTGAQATTFVTNYVNSFNIADSQFSVSNLTVTKLTNGFHVSAVGSMKTIFLPLTKMAKWGSGISTLDADIVSEVVNSSNRVELALVFDNTGSMTDYAGSNPCASGSDRMSGLKCAATTLVTYLSNQLGGTGSPELKIALVPFEGAVNVGVDTSNPPSWIDWKDDSAVQDSEQPFYSGMNFAQKNFGTSYSPKNRNVSPRWLYGKLGISWAGCVEMRAEPYDTLDTPPDTSNPDTLWEPMFWPDEPDSTSDWNNYLNDGVSGSFSARQMSLTKYDKSSPSLVSWQSGRKDTSYPYTYGPNRGCPRPITALTTDTSAITTAINAMQPQGATGTFIPAGLEWGWHVLSHDAPFTEGVGSSDEYFDKTVKALILLSDGANSPSISVTESYYYGDENKSTYSAFGYPALRGDRVVSGQHYYYRLQNVNSNSIPTDSRATDILNSKTASLCTNAKNVGIRLYTITFGPIDTTAENLMRDCASTDTDGTKLYYNAPDSQELSDIFNKIGQDLSDIHLSM